MTNAGQIGESVLPRTSCVHFNLYVPGQQAGSQNALRKFKQTVALQTSRYCVTNKRLHSCDAVPSSTLKKEGVCFFEKNR
jgi:hypothetical protein